MITLDKFRKLVFAFPEVKEMPHFEKISFRVKNKIFATFDAKDEEAVLKFSKNDQEFFSSASGSCVYPIDNKWGQQGWTKVELNSVNLNLFKDMLIIAYCECTKETCRFG
ncbi:MmcQ/YjbR family DNA-binding protein [Leptospira ilyithenensis]|uniref:MmcQ/YjbR family DNA-binding protein n=1 Tax=Leptospira ilyithenensis TaxID=2484901 RepID=UPI00143831B2|nr:MmcQ/YjbR family DNA-binding protein [Leptospira ilyithenensis]